MKNPELLEWYFAYLRKDFQSRDASDFTPMALVKADQEIIKQRISDEQKLIAAQQELTAAPVSASSPLRIFPGLQRKWLLLICMAISAVLFVTLLALPEYTFLAQVCTAILLALCLLLFFGEQSIEKNIADLSSLKRQNELLKEKEVLTFDYCPYILCELDETFAIRSTNFKASSLWSKSSKDLLGIDILSLIAEQSREVLSESLQRSRRFSNADCANIVIISRGERIDLLWRSEWSETAKAYFCLAEDISIRMENERIKAEMSTMITHDLKAPISALVFWIDNMLSGCYGELHEDAVFSLKRTDRSLRSVLSLLDNLMDVEKLDSALVPCNKQKIRLDDCFTRVTDLLSDWLKEAQLTIDCQETDIKVLADQEQVDRILVNFCSNAIKVSPPGASILLRARRDGQNAIIEVVDNGPGIPANLKESLFQRWVSPATRNQKLSAGSGIGLYAARKFAELQNGSVGALDGDKQGTILWFSLPLTD